jgi:cell division protease FtsH
MSEALGMVEYGEQEEHVFLGRELGRGRGYSEATQQEIDREVRRFIDSAYERAKELIVANRDKLDALAKALLEYESLDGVQVRAIVETGLMPPPLIPKSEGSSPQGSAPAAVVAAEKSGKLADEVPLPIAEGLSGAPA